MAADDIENPAPLDYSTPKFPSLYWPILVRAGEASYLYYSRDVWKFTTLWTLIVYGAVHLAASLYAAFMQPRSWKVMWLVPVIYVVVGSIEAIIAGSIIGGLLSAVYDAGSFKMSTWIPCIWSFINVLILILSSFAIQGGL
ncbi:hypothetical protein L228DRAFT_269055 [Xylona heveae TC161]|uniref:Integral membrane protein n=1 Tax=Xylona heveae (strain CBS 132557 / TC161) TaxID=1328760 RepID=A0A165G053_XYLHT|nr:hypothetical protein L228DRAFT_269055 [Xylona heveae TC161]KZF21585.1 hypothetical protein L228DRAFT_269055 [Xylona heveae TC161]